MMSQTKKQYGGVDSLIFEEAVVFPAGLILECEAADLRGVSFVALCVPSDGDQRFDQIQELVHGEQERVEFETRLLRKTGEPFWGNLTAAVLTGTAKRPLTLLVPLRETTA